MYLLFSRRQAPLKPTSTKNPIPLPTFSIFYSIPNSSRFPRFPSFPSFPSSLPDNALSPFVTKEIILTENHSLHKTAMYIFGAVARVFRPEALSYA